MDNRTENHVDTVHLKRKLDGDTETYGHSQHIYLHGTDTLLLIKLAKTDFP